MKANWKPKKVNIGFDSVMIKRGEFFTSQEKLGIAFRWDRSSVRKFLDLLKKERMIDTVTTTKYTKIIICKYDTYQDISPTKDQRDNNNTTSTQHQHNTTKKDKERKEGEEGKPKSLATFFEVFKRSAPKEFTDEMINKEIELFKEKYSDATPNNARLINAWVSRMKVSDHPKKLTPQEEYTKQMMKAI